MAEHRLHCTTTFEFEGVSGSRREFIGWLLKVCAQNAVKPADLMDADAIELLAERLRTALQIEMHMTLAFEHAFRLGERRVSAEVVEQVLSRAIDELPGDHVRFISADAAASAMLFVCKSTSPHCPTTPQRCSICCAR